MRIEQLVLTAYGAFAERVLDVREAPGLCVVYGPNEAGKSTCLAATLDFLFGIPHASPHGSVFGYDKMRLDGVVRSADGELTSLRRRKGRAGRTLSDGEGAAVDEAVLGRAFGAFTRERYRALFALDHASLRSGGEALLGSRGEIGRLIVEAGGGLAPLMPLIAGLDAEADAQFGVRVSKERAFYRALTGFDQSVKAIREGTLTREAFEAADAEVSRLRVQIAEQRARQRALRSEQQDKERLLRVGPLVRELERVEQALADEGPAQAPSLAQCTLLEGLLAEEAEQVRALARASSELARADERAQAIVVDEPLLAREAELSALDERRQRYELVREREQGLRDELLRAEVLLAEQARHLAPEAAAYAEAAAHYDALSVEAQRVLEQQRDTRALAARVAEDEAEAQRAREKQAAHVARGEDRPFTLELSPLTELAGQAGELGRSRARLGRERGELEAALAALGFPDVSALSALPVPELARVRASADADLRSAEQREKLGRERAAAARRRELQVERLRLLRDDSKMPDPDSWTRAKRARGHAWADVRGGYLSLHPPKDPLFEPARRSDFVLAFERAMSAADEAADDLLRSAERVAEARVVAQSITDADAELAHLDAEIAREERAHAERRAALFAGFAEVEPRAPDAHALLALIERRSELLRRAGELTAREAELGRSAASVEAGEALLAAGERELALAHDGAALPVRVARLLAQVRVRDAAYAELTRTREVEAAHAPERDRRRRELAEREAALAVQRRVFGEAARALGLSAELAPEATPELVSRVRERAQAELVRTRVAAELADITQAEARLAEALEALAPVLHLTGAAEAPAALARLARDRLQEARAQRGKRLALQEQRAAAEAEQRSRADALASVRGRLAELSRSLGVAQEELPQALQRGQRMHAASTRRAELVGLVEQAGDGHPLARLRDELAGRDASDLRAELPGLAEELARVTSASDEALTALAHAERELARFSGEGAINGLVADRERYAAELVASAERYLGLRVARELLSRAVDRVRTEQRDPLVARASALFALATEQAYEGIATDVSEGEPVVYGVRAGGAQVALSEMSDGTRDQLFLAFRLASVEHYCRVREPLPFLGDDLLVHFDDARAKATLGLLAELGKSTQVLLFTHHRAVCDAAAPWVEAGTARVVTL